MVPAGQGFAPQTGDGGVGVALMSYCDQVILSVVSDSGHLTEATNRKGDPVRPIEHAFVDEIQRLKALAREELETRDMQRNKKAQ